MTPGGRCQCQGKAVIYPVAHVWAIWARPPLAVFCAPIRFRSESELPLLPDLRGALHCRAGALRVAPPREFTLSAAAPAVVYTDAHGAGRITAAIFLPGAEQPRVRHTHMPALSRGDVLKIGISEYELAAAAPGVLWASGISPVRLSLLSATT